MHLGQLVFTYISCGSFGFNKTLLFNKMIKNKERIQNFKETGNLRYIYKNELDRAYIQHDLPYWDFKDLPR